MLRRVRTSAMLSLVALALAVGSACGGSVVDSTTGGTGMPPDAGGDSPDAAPDCGDMTVCSNDQNSHGCFGATAVGAVCSFLATPCEPVPPDCSKLGPIFGVSVTAQSCGNGLSSCHVDWSGSVDAGMLAKLCDGRDAVMMPIDCVGN